MSRNLRYIHCHVRALEIDKYSCCYIDVCVCVCVRAPPFSAANLPQYLSERASRWGDCPSCRAPLAIYFVLVSRLENPFEWREKVGNHEGGCDDEVVAQPQREGGEGGVGRERLAASTAVRSPYAARR